MIVPADAASYQEKSRIVIQKSHHVTISPRLESAKGKREESASSGCNRVLKLRSSVVCNREEEEATCLAN